MSALRSVNTFDFKTCELEAIEGKPESQFLLAHRYYLNDASVACLHPIDRLHLSRAWLETGIRTISVTAQEEKTISSKDNNLLSAMKTLRKKIILLGGMTKTTAHDLFLTGKFAEASKDKSTRSASLHWYKVAAANGSEFACTNLSNHYLELFNQTEKTDYILEAIKWDTLASITSAKKGNPHRQLELGLQASREKRYQDAAEFFLLASKVNPEAACLLGLLTQTAILRKIPLSCANNPRVVSMM